MPDVALPELKVDSSILSLTTKEVLTFQWGPFSRLGLTFSWCCSSKVRAAACCVRCAV